MAVAKLRAFGNYDVDAASREAGLKCEDESLTQQSFAEEADINVILKRFNITGQLPEGVRVPTFGDFEDVYDFASAMNAIALARESFDAMPAEVRYEFNNDPQRFLEFTADPRNLPRMRELGLAVPEVVNPPAASPAPAGAPAGASAPSSSDTGST